MPNQILIKPKIHKKISHKNSHNSNQLKYNKNRFESWFSKKKTKKYIQLQPWIVRNSIIVWIFPKKSSELWLFSLFFLCNNTKFSLWLTKKQVACLKFKFQINTWIKLQFVLSLFSLCILPMKIRFSHIFADGNFCSQYGSIGKNSG